MTNDAIVLELNDILNRIAYLRSCILDIDAAREVGSGACPAPTDKVEYTCRHTNVRFDFVSALCVDCGKDMTP